MDWNKEAKLCQRVKADLIDRSHQGLWAHPASAFLVLATTELPHRAPLLSVVFVASLLCVTALRIAVLRTIWSGADRGDFWYRVYHVLILCGAGVWGGTLAVSLWRFGYRDPSVLIEMLYHAAITFAMVNVWVHDRRLMAVSLVLLLVVPTVGDLLHRGSSPLPYLGAAVTYLLYCSAQGYRLHRLYEQQISDNYELSIAAYQDCLTGLPNRLYMDEKLDDCFDAAKARRMQTALLYIDLDGFKQINDRYSHKVGDQFLHEAAQRIRRRIRDEDVAARIGGDEFVILIPECASEGTAKELADRVLSDTREPVLIDGHALTYSASIGISHFPATARNRDDLVRSADEAMYLAKRSGKCRVCVAPLRAVQGPATELEPDGQDQARAFEMLAGHA